VSGRPEGLHDNGVENAPRENDKSKQVSGPGGRTGRASGLTARPQVGRHNRILDLHRDDHGKDDRSGLALPRIADCVGDRRG